MHQRILSTEWKGNPLNGRKMFANHISNKRLICRIYKKTLTTQKQKIKQPNLENGQRTYILIFQSCHNKYRRLGSWNNRNLFSHSAGGWKSRIKVSAVLVSPKASLFGLQMASPPCVLFSVHKHPWYLPGVFYSPLLIRIPVRLD